MAAAPRHTPLEDLQGVVSGTLMCALGLLFLRDAGLVTGQAAGAALVLSYATPASFGLWFAAISLPFYAFALWRIGWRFTLKSLAAVALFSVVVELAPQAVAVGPTHPVAAAAVGGLCSGFGLLALFRHGASLGGVGVVAVWVQDALGFRAGYVQALVDVAVFAAAAAVLDWPAVAASAFGAGLLNLVIAVNHRRDRYVAL